MRRLSASSVRRMRGVEEGMAEEVEVEVFWRLLADSEEEEGRTAE